jgi:hypothetical protein
MSDLVRRTLAMPVAAVILLAALALATMPSNLSATANVPSGCHQIMHNGKWQCADPNIDPGHGENDACGTDWHCKTLNKGGCACLDIFPKSKNGCISTGTWTANANVAIAPNTTVIFTLAPAGGNELDIADFSNIADDGTVQSFLALTGATDFTGQFIVQLGSSSNPDSIPVHLVGMSLHVASITFRGNPTGTNTVSSNSSTGFTPGYYRPSTGQMQFLQQVPCVWQCTLFPSGQTVWLSPAFQNLGGNVVSTLPLAAVYFDDFFQVPLLVPPAWLALGALLLLAGVGAVWGRRRAEV